MTIGTLRCPLSTLMVDRMQRANSKDMNLTTPEESHKFLVKIGASPRLIRHVKLVGEAADEILSFLEVYGAKIDNDFVRVGVAIHDAGKIACPAELDNSGNEH